MENSQWRGSTYIAALVDLILSGFGLLYIIILTIWLGGYYFLGQGTGTFWIVIYVFVSVAILAIQIWAATNLIRATERNLDPAKALVKCKNWRVFTIIFLFISLIGNLLTMSYITLAIQIVIKGVFLMIVLSFMKELKAASNSDDDLEDSGVESPETETHESIEIVEYPVLNNENPVPFSKQNGALARFEEEKEKSKTNILQMMMALF